MYDVKIKKVCRLTSKVRKGFFSSIFDNTDLGLNAGLKRFAWWIDVRTIVTPLQATNLATYIRTFLKWLSKLLKGEVQKTIEEKKSQIKIVYTSRKQTIIEQKLSFAKIDWNGGWGEKRYERSGFY